MMAEKKMGKFRKLLNDVCDVCGDTLEVRVVSDTYNAQNIMSRIIEREHVVCMTCKEERHSSKAKSNRNRKNHKDIEWK